MCTFKKQIFWPVPVAMVLDQCDKIMFVLQNVSMRLSQYKQRKLAILSYYRKVNTGNFDKFPTHAMVYHQALQSDISTFHGDDDDDAIPFSAYLILYINLFAFWVCLFCVTTNWRLPWRVKYMKNKIDFVLKKLNMGDLWLIFNKIIPMGYLECCLKVFSMLYLFFYDTFFKHRILVEHLSLV